MPIKEPMTRELPLSGSQGSQALTDRKHHVPKHLLEPDPNERVFINIRWFRRQDGPLVTEWLIQPHQKSLPYPSSEADEGLCPSQKFPPFLCPDFSKDKTFPVALQWTQMTWWQPHGDTAGLHTIGWVKYIFFHGRVKTCWIANFSSSQGAHSIRHPKELLTAPNWGSTEGMTRPDLRDPNCPTRAHPLTSSKATPAPDTSLSCWGHWKRKIHGLKSYGKIPEPFSLCFPPISFNNPVKLNPGWINLFPQTNGQLFRHHIGIFRVCVHFYWSSLGFFCKWLLLLPRQHALFNSASLLMFLIQIPAPQGYPSQISAELWGILPYFTTSLVAQKTYSYSYLSLKVLSSPKLVEETSSANTQPKATASRNQPPNQAWQIQDTTWAA